MATTTVIQFFDHPFFNVIGGVSTILMILGFLYTAYLVFAGVIPVWYRLGMGLSKRKIAIFGSEEAYSNISSSLMDSKIFKGKTIRINTGNIEKAKDETIFLVDWETFSDHIEEVFNARKNHQTAIVIFAKPGSITPQDKMTDLANRTNTVVVNFKGRLLNDVLTSMITTSYDKR